MNRKLTNNELILFCEQLGMVLHSGLSAIEGIVIMREEAEEEGSDLAQLFREMQQNYEETGVLCDVLEESGAFPDYMTRMVRVGEQTGNMDEVMRGLAAHYEREENMIQDIKNAVTYPLIMLGMMLVIVLVILVKVMPVFAEVYSQLGSELTGAGAVFLRAGEGLSHYYGVLIAVILLLAAAVLWLFRTEKGKAAFRSMAGGFFGTKKMVTMMGTARFLSALSMGLRSGLDYGSALSMASELVEENASLAGKAAVCREKAEEGEGVANAMKEAGLLSGLNARMLYVAETTGETEAALHRLALQIDEAVSVRIRNFVAMLEPTMVAALSVLVGGLLLSVMVPLMGVLSSIQ